MKETYDESHFLRIDEGLSVLLVVELLVFLLVELLVLLLDLLLDLLDAYHYLQLILLDVAVGDVVAGVKHIGKDV